MEIYPFALRNTCRSCFTGDVYGSIEALLGMFSTFDSQLCELRVVHHDVGPVTEADVNLAESLNGKIHCR